MGCIKMTNQMEKVSGDISPLAAILIFAATFLLALFILGVVYYSFGNSVTLLVQEPLLAVLPLGYMLYKRVDIRNYIGLEVKLKTVLLGIASGGLVFLFDLVISTTLTSVFGVTETIKEVNTMYTNMSSSLQGLLILIITFSLAGVCEEFTFRGFLQAAVDRRYSFVPAVLVSSFAFSLIHFDPQLVYTLSAFLIGLLLGYIYHRWHSYVVSAIAHASINLIALAVILLIG
jgi:membrane protease YdiL (CAAX protease family)